MPIDYEHVQLVKIEGTRRPRSGKSFVKNLFQHEMHIKYIIIYLVTYLLLIMRQSV